MDEKKKKQQLLFLGSLFFAAILISSYAGFGSNSAATSSTTTVEAQHGSLAFGGANAVVESYFYAPVVGIRSNSSVGVVGNTLLALQNKGYVSTYQQYGNSFEVWLQNYSAYDLQQTLLNSTNSTALTVNATTYVSLPTTMTMTAVPGNILVPVIVPKVNYSVVVEPLPAPGTKIPVEIQAYVAPNGTIYTGPGEVRITVP